MGVFASGPISAGELIEQCHALPLERNWQRIDTVLNHYLFAWPYDGDGRALAFGIASVFNHGDAPNVTWRTLVQAQRIDFRALRDIAAGEELLIDYGAEYWQQATRYSHPTSAPQRSILPVRLVDA